MNAAFDFLFDVPSLFFDATNLLFGWLTHTSSTLNQEKASAEIRGEFFRPDFQVNLRGIIWWIFCAFFLQLVKAYYSQKGMTQSDINLGHQFFLTIYAATYCQIICPDCYLNRRHSMKRQS